MVRLALPNTPYVEPATGKAVEGRMQVYLHGTNTHAPLYVRPAAEYIDAANPQLIHAGLPYATLFTPLGVFDVVIEKYIGPEGEMSVYSPDSDFEQVGDYETGIDFDIESLARNTVDTVADLRDVDPSLGMVTVKWYSEPGDCPPRTYVWDADSQNTEDGGYVIGSDVSDSGNWILMWDDEVLPCSVYGVKPVTETNISLLLSYPAVVGSFSMVTAPRVRFTRGTYTTNNTWSTAKEIVFDPGAKFSNGKFTCPKVQVIGTRDDYVANFSFTAEDAVAHSSWFKTLDAFWHCGAKRLVIDGTNYFTSSQLATTANLENVTIEGAKRMSATYASGKYIKLTRCSVEGFGIFDPDDDFVSFTGMRWQNSIWNSSSASAFDFGKIADGHHVEFSITNSNILQLADFANTEIYLKLVDQLIGDSLYNNTVADLDGRTVSSFNYAHFTKLQNAHVTGNVTLTSAPSNFSFENVTVDGYVSQGSGAINVVDSTLVWNNEPAAGASIAARNSSVSSTGTWVNNHQITVEGGSFGISINNVSDNTTATSGIVIENSRLMKASNTIKTKKLTIRDSYIKNQVIEVYPYKSGADYKIFLDLCGNVIDNTQDIHFTRLDSVGGSEDMDCKEMKLEVFIVGNDFVGSGNLHLDFWAAPSRRSLFLDVTPSVHAYRYEGNTGSAPLEKWIGYKDSTTNSYSWVYGKDGTTPLQYYVHQVGRVSPGFNEALATNGFYQNWAKYAWKQTFSYSGCGTAAALDDTVKGDWYDCMFVSTTDVTGAVRVV